MTFEVDMSKQPEGRSVLTGINLWRITEAKMGTSKKGDAMLTLKLKCGEAELRDNLMLQGGGWGIGRAKLLALGFKEDQKFVIDPVALYDLKVWVATKPREYSYVKDGRTITGTDIEVDINLLKHSGYQHELSVPDGATPPPEPEAFEIF